MSEPVEVPEQVTFKAFAEAQTAGHGSPASRAVSDLARGAFRSAGRCPAARRRWSWRPRGRAEGGPSRTRHDAPIADIGLSTNTQMRAACEALEEA